MSRAFLAALGLLLLAALCQRQAAAGSVTLAWDAGVPQAGQVAGQGYVLTRNGVEVLRTDTTSATDTLPAPGTYAYTVQATAQGARSAPSNAVQVTATPLTCTYTTSATAFSVQCATPPVVPPGPYPLRPVGTVTATADSAETVGEPGQAARAVDGQPSTRWHTQWTNGAPPLPHTLTLDLGAVLWVEGLSYLPRQDGGLNGTLVQYRIETSLDGVTWTVASSGTWAGDASAKRGLFAAVQARRVRLVGLAELHGQPWASAAEVGVYAVEGTP